MIIPDQKQTLMDAVREESMRVAGALLKSAVGLLFMLGLVGIGSITGLRANTVAPAAVIAGDPAPTAEVATVAKVRNPAAGYAAPVATGRLRSLTHSLHEPG